ncbi:MAG: hypothetical protein JXA77_09630 [Bacteroidales bacterium]|nr:hypothetical protein [Bacteroidales bacterium]MBN2818530.1 hypothetical protein [Bacteroidales bacterium]
MGCKYLFQEDKIPAHLDAFGLINMNGRVYDPRMGRMLSPNIMVQAPDFTQNYNRYTYAFNNPLAFTNPSGWEGEPLMYTPSGMALWTTTDVDLYYRHLNDLYNGRVGQQLSAGWDFSPPDMWDVAYNMPKAYDGNGMYLDYDQRTDHVKY